MKFKNSRVIESQLGSYRSVTAIGKSTSGSNRCVKKSFEDVGSKYKSINKVTSSY